VIPVLKVRGEGVFDLNPRMVDVFVMFRAIRTGELLTSYRNFLNLEGFFAKAPSNGVGIPNLKRCDGNY
jgi:hypothetical protein